MATVITQQEENDKKKGVITSTIVHLALLVLALLPLITFPDPPPGQSGIVVALGEPDAGQGNDLPAPPPDATEEEEEPAPPEEVTPEEPEPEPEPVKEPEKPKKPEPDNSKKVNTDDNSRELALKKAKEKKEREERLKKQREEEAKKKAEAEAKRKAEAEKKRQAEEAARKKAEAEAKKKAEAQKLKEGIGNAFGQGNKNKPGSQGDPNGDPNSKVLEGISTGSGTIGGGLENRGGQGPPLRDKSQETGRIVVKVCVDANGRVTSAKYTQRGSTSSSRNLIKLAEANAKRYTFSKGSVDRQCGTISYLFQVK
ncbi:MAG: cell envelope integrity protein TolA [Bacteroidota bacterium]